MQLNFKEPRGPARRSEAALTLWEVLIAIVIVMVVFASIINGYVFGARATQWTGYALAAQTLSSQCLEQARSAVWDPAMSGKPTEVTNMALMNYSITYNGANWTLTGYTTNILDIPWKGTNFVVATNYITIQQFYANNDSSVQVQLQSVQVNTVWPFNGWGNFRINYYTNSICTYLGPDNRDPSTLW